MTKKRERHKIPLQKLKNYTREGRHDINKVLNLYAAYFVTLK